ncbi:MAG TPA: L,D-transpeptidase [Gaiellaceae bacterium]|nr:L,D-transpeptidase [Gaiellaceae bacterium]
MRGRLFAALVLLAAASAGVALLTLGRGAAADDAPTAAPAPVAGRAGETRPRPVRVPACAPGAVVSLGNGRIAYAARVRSRVTAFRAPGRRPFARFGRLNVNRVPTVLGVLGARLDARCRPAWYRVQLPLRPNGVHGWVRADAVATRIVHARIVVDLSERRVTLFRDGVPRLVAIAAIGSPSTPTPVGRYYVNQKLVAPDPLGPFGPVALGISAFSPVLESWAQGGPIAIHGTNEEGLLGGAVSHGCVRVRNEEVLRLWRLAPTGTPVLIRM